MHQTTHPASFGPVFAVIAFPDPPPFEYHLYVTISIDKERKRKRKKTYHDSSGFDTGNWTVPPGAQH